MTDRYEKIREALAMGPTPGPWEQTATSHYDYLYIKMAQVVGREPGHIATANYCSTRKRQRANAALIAACDPDTIKSLLEELDSLRVELDEANDKIKAAQEQKPVFVWHKSATPEESEVFDVDCACECCVPLYTNPVPAGKPATRQNIIDVLLSTRGQSEGVTADAILGLLSDKWAATVPDAIQLLQRVAASTTDKPAVTVTDGWNLITHENWNLPKLGQRVILFSNGVVQNESFVLDQTDGEYGSGCYFWSRDDLDECPEVKAGDMWMAWPDSAAPSPAEQQPDVSALVEALECLYNAIDSCIELTPDIMRKTEAALAAYHKGAKS